MKISENYEWVCLTPEDGEYMFGYYDRCPWSRDNSLHLALKIPSLSRLPRTGETAEAGFVRRESRKFVKIAETRAWCHQQGAMTLWLDRMKDCFVFNDYFVKEKKPGARIFNINGSELGRYDLPLYSVSGDGRWGASLNFGRIPRRGYSFADLPLENEPDTPDTDNDGIFLVDLESGKSKLIAPYGRLIAEHPFPWTLKESFFYLAHITFNCDSSRLMVLLEQIRAKNDLSGGQTCLFTMRIDGSDLICSLPSPYWHDTAAGSPDRISHEIWGRRPREILIDADWFGKGNQYVVFDESRRTLKAEKISDGLGPHGHLVFSPDGKLMAADTYPDKNSVERLGIVEMSTGAVTEAGRFSHRGASPLADLRCDLHPRWSRDSETLTVDSIHGGPRKIYMLELSKNKGARRKN
jgi:hypothetical protein